MGCLSPLTMPLVSDSDCDGEHNFPLSRRARSLVISLVAESAARLLLKIDV